MVSNSPIVDMLMKTVNGIFIVLNDQRRIIASNDAFLNLLGTDNIKKIFGARLGDALRCVHAPSTPTGCGTGQFCSTCGAAAAIEKAIESNHAVQEKCCATIAAISEAGDYKTVDICFMVNAAPLILMGERFILLFLQDITEQEDWAALESAFFHDINNTITALLGTSEMAVRKNKNNDLVKSVYQLSLRLTKEIEIQNILVRAEYDNYRLAMQETSAEKIFSELEVFFSNNPRAVGRVLSYPESCPADTIFTDHMLLLRILTNMVTNACEASEIGDRVRIGIEKKGDALVFSVWNKQYIPARISQRIFQKHFSTKGGSGRGIGTHAIKLFGERYLKGRISFTTSREAGTTFSFRLPIPK
jgi:signal transduction histidine kinase